MSMAYPGITHCSECGGKINRLGRCESCVSKSEGKSSEQVGKYKLIDVLNKMVNGELKYNTKIIWDEREYAYKGDNEVYRKMGNIEVDLWNDMCMDDLESECELIEPDHIPTDNTKIEELDIRDTYLQEGILKLTDKLNEVIRYINKGG